MTLRLDPFYPIVDSAAWVARLVPAGAKVIQLRIKNRDDVEILDAVRLSLSLCTTHDAQLIVNDHWQIAIDAGANFVHLGQSDLDNADLNALRARGIRFGVSTHDYAELDRALSTDPDYLALGPIYPTTLKIMPWAPQGLERIGEWKRLIGSRPLVAIGGITLERARQCLRAGAEIVSVVSDVVGHADPVARTREWISETRAAA